MFTAALLEDHPRHAEALPLVEAARRGALLACTTRGILCEVYAILTSERAAPPHSPAQAAEAIRRLVAVPSAIGLLDAEPQTLLELLRLAEAHQLRGRRIHDARHAAQAIVAGVLSAYTYDVADWTAFQSDGLTIAGPPSSVRAS